MSQAKRLSRKQLRGPDEFQTLSQRALDWARENRRTVWIGGAALGAVLLASAIAIGVIRSRRTRAAQEFYAAHELFRRGQWTEALEDFDRLAEGFGGTSYGRLARLYAARAALRAGDNARAVELYRAFLADGAPSPAVEQLARLNLAAALAAEGKREEARAELDRARQIQGPAGALALIRLARMADEAGDRDRAVELYQAYLRDFPRGADAAEARSRLVALGAKPPASPPLVPPTLQIQ